MLPEILINLCWLLSGARDATPFSDLMKEERFAIIIRILGH